MSVLTNELTLLPSHDLHSSRLVVKKLIIFTGVITGIGIAGGEVTVEVELEASVIIHVTGTGIADIEAGVGLEAGAEAEAVVKVLVIVENVEEVNMMMRDLEKADLMEGISSTQS